MIEPLRKAGIVPTNYYRIISWPRQPNSSPDDKVDHPGKRRYLALNAFLG